jgi:hypothetical protein
VWLPARLRITVTMRGWLLTSHNMLTGRLLHQTMLLILSWILMRLILILTPHQDQLLVSLVNQFTFISLVILADVLSCRGVVHLASSFLLLSSGKVSQMAALTERPQEWHIHMTTSHKDGCSYLPKLGSMHLGSLSTCFRISSLLIYTTTASLLWAILRDP